jgi:galactokinase/mevalonate kinase-like predicted kinase
LGQQDVFGCCIGGFKKIEFTQSGLPKYTFLPTKFFDYFTPYLMFTGLTRNSTEVLKSVSTPDDDVFNPLVDESEKYILNGSYEKFLTLLSKGWEEKKKSSKDVLKDQLIKNMDEYLKNYPNCLSHKLCGAGNGGFFLCFFPNDKLPTDSRFFKLTLSTSGVQRVI